MPYIFWKAPNETLKLAGRDGKFYVDEKYIHSACGTAYIGMLKCLDFLFEIKGIPEKGS